MSLKCTACTVDAVSCRTTRNADPPFPRTWCTRPRIQTFEMGKMIKREAYETQMSNRQNCAPTDPQCLDYGRQTTPQKEYGIDIKSLVQHLLRRVSGGVPSVVLTSFLKGSLTSVEKTPTGLADTIEYSRPASEKSFETMNQRREHRKLSWRCKQRERMLMNGTSSLITVTLTPTIGTHDPNTAPHLVQLRSSTSHLSTGATEHQQPSHPHTPQERSQHETIQLQSALR